MAAQTEAENDFELKAEDYERLTKYSEQRRQELSTIFAPVVKVTDHYGTLVCRVTSALWQSRPVSKQDGIVRDLMADAFDFLWEWRRPLLEGRLHVAYPLARRSYESISLLSACAQDSSLADAWETGKRITNAATRKALASAPMHESEEALKGLYNFFSEGAHPNRSLVAYRYLGEGNRFVLGSIVMPDLVLATDHCIRLIQMWFWLTAAVGYFFRVSIDKTDASFGQDYLETVEEAKTVVTWLSENFNRLLQEGRGKPS